MDENNVIRTKVEVDTTQAQIQVAKLSSVASNSTKELSERVAAKNEQIEIQNKLSKQTIETLEEEAKSLEGVVGKEKELEKIIKKLNSERIKAEKLSLNNAKAQDKLNEAFSDAKNPVKNLDEATGGLLGKFKLLMTNPIGLVIGALVGIFTLFKEAVGKSEGATSSFSKIAGKLSGVMNGILNVLKPVVEFIGEKLLYALESPGQAFEDLGKAIEENIINRFKAVLVLGKAFTALMEGDLEKATKLAGDGFIQMATGITDGVDKLGKLGSKVKELYNEGVTATDALVGSERRLVMNRIAMEKQQLTSLRLAEKERQIRDDTSKTIEERIAANKRLGVVLDEQAKRELSLAQQNLKIEKLKAANSNNSIEDLEAVGAAEVKLLEIQERITGQRSEQLVNENSLLKERSDLIDAAKKKADEDAKIQKEKDAQAAKEALDRKIREIEAQIELDTIETERKKLAGEDTLAAELELLERKKELELMNLDLLESEKQVIREKYADQKKKLEDISAAAEIANREKVDKLAMDGLGELFGLQKEVAIARMIMEAPQAVASSFRNAAAAYPFPLSVAMGAAGAAATVVPIVKGLSDIKKVRFSKSKGSSGGGGGGSSGATGVSTSSVGDLSANNAARMGIDPSLTGNAATTASARVSGGSSGNIVFSEGQYQDFQNQITFKESKTSI